MAKSNGRWVTFTWTILGTLAACGVAWGVLRTTVKTNCKRIDKVEIVVVDHTKQITSLQTALPYIQQSLDRIEKAVEKE